MDAIILVGGQGNRLRPLTSTRHKSLVPLVHRPAIEYLFDWLRRGGITRAVLAIGQNNGDLAAAYPEGDLDGLEIMHIFERERLESGGAIRNACRMAGINERFLVVNGDIFVDFDLREALAAHDHESAELTLALYRVDDPSSFGVAVVDDDGLVTGFVEKPPPGTVASDLINAGAWIFEPGLVDEIPRGAVRVEETLFPSLVARGRKVYGYQFEGLWQDIGTPARYLELARTLAERDPGGAIAPGAAVDADATVQGSAVGDGSRVLEGAAVECSVLWEKVTVEARARVMGSILADGVIVGECATVDGAVIGSNAEVAPGATVPRGTTIEARGRFEAS